MVSDLHVILSQGEKIVETKVLDNWEQLKTLEFRLMTNIQYDVTVWADFGDEHYTVDFVTGDVSYASLDVKEPSMKRDAFYGQSKLHSPHR